MIPTLQLGQFGRALYRGDPYFLSVSALLHFDGTDGSTTFTDVKGGSWSANGNAQLDTAQSVSGGASLLLDGTGDYVSGPTGSAFSFGAGDFTVEFWFRPRVTMNSGTGQKALAAKWGGASSEWLVDFYGPGNGVRCVYYNGTSSAVLAPGSSYDLSAGTWYHIAWSRIGDNHRLFINGASVNTQSGLNAFGAMNSGAQAVLIGYKGDGGGTEYADGHIEEFRITKGVGRYLDAFTAPSAAFPDY